MSQGGLCLCRNVREHSRLLSIFQKFCLLLGGLTANLSLGYELILLLVHSKGTLLFHYWLCSGHDHLCLPASQPEHCWAAQLAGTVASPSDQMGLEDILCSRWS